MFRTVHPFELLRAVARTRRISPGELAAEAAWGLTILAQEEPAAVLPACRRLLERQPACGPLWWLSARVLVADDPAFEAERCGLLLEDDRTPEQVHDTLRSLQNPDRRIVRRGGIAELAVADVVMVEAYAIGPEAMFLPTAEQTMLKTALSLEIPIWVESGVGRLLPRKIWEALVVRLGGRSTDDHATSHVISVPESPDGSVEPLDGVEMIVGPSGPVPITNLDLEIARSDCPEPPELVAGW
jgi:hypothetical protein